MKGHHTIDFSTTIIESTNVITVDWPCSVKTIHYETQAEIYDLRVRPLPLMPPIARESYYSREKQHTRLPDMGRGARASQYLNRAMFRSAQELYSDLR